MPRSESATRVNKADSEEHASSSLEDGLDLIDNRPDAGGEWIYAGQAGFLFGRLQTAIALSCCERRRVDADTHALRVRVGEGSR